MSRDSFICDKWRDSFICDMIHVSLTQREKKNTATHCNTLQHTETHCNTLQHTVWFIYVTWLVHLWQVTWLVHLWHDLCITHSERKKEHRNTLQHTATRCNTLQHTATHCNTLYDSYMWRDSFICDMWRDSFICDIIRVSLTQREKRNTATHCNTLQHTATHCNTLQHTLFGTPIWCVYVMWLIHLWQDSITNSKKKVGWQMMLCLYNWYDVVSVRFIGTQSRTQRGKRGWQIMVCLFDWDDVVSVPWDDVVSVRFIWCVARDFDRRKKNPPRKISFLACFNLKRRRKKTSQEPSPCFFPLFLSSFSRLQSETCPKGDPPGGGRSPPPQIKATPLGGRGSPFWLLVNSRIGSSFSFFFPSSSRLFNPKYAQKETLPGGGRFLRLRCWSVTWLMFHYNTMQHTATHCNTLQHTAQHTATHTRLRCWSVTWLMYHSLIEKKRAYNHTQYIWFICVWHDSFISNVTHVSLTQIKGRGWQKGGAAEKCTFRCVCIIHISVTWLAHQ